MIQPPDFSAYRDLVHRALLEDVGSGDVTTRAVVPSDRQATAVLEARVTCIVAGLDVFAEVFRQVDVSVHVEKRSADGDRCESGQALASVRGPARAILTGERTALNFIQYLSGIATLTRRFVDAAHDTLTVLDTRKTTPTLRALAKYAVRCGGGTNHRFGLFDAVLIKDNHIRVAGSVGEAVRRVRAAGHTGPIEVEAQSLDEVERALEANADIVMLDNFDDAGLRDAVRLIARRARVEISGGITLERLVYLGALGVDCVSVGALTHSAPAVDISLEIET